MEMASLAFYFSFSLCLCLLLVIVRLLEKLWWTPIRIQSKMRSQGIKGPSYRFLYGNNQEILSMVGSASSSPQELSHNAFRVIQPHIYSWIKLYGPNFLHWFGSRARLVVTEPEMIKEILNDKDGALSKTLNSIHVKKLLGDGVITSEGRKWLKMRRLANRALSRESLKSMIPVKIASVEMMLERWRNRDCKEIEAFEEFELLTSEIISRTAFGSSYSEGQHIFEMLTKLLSIAAENSLKVRIPVICNLFKTHDDIEVEKLERGIRNSIINLIKETEKKAAKLEKPNDHDNSYLGLHLQAYHDSDKTKKISIDDMVDECKTMYLAGQETSATALSWTILLLAIHTDWQEKARQEVVELLGHRNPTAESFGKMNIMTMIINESLRLYSPVVFIMRKVKKELKLGNLILPAGMEVFISTLAIHHNPDIWGQDVHLFKPERFAEGVAKATNNNLAAFFPFGLGPRTCAGFNFSIMETKIALSMMLQRYKFTLSPTYVHSPTTRVTLRGKHGIQILLQPL